MSFGVGDEIEYNSDPNDDENSTLHTNYGTITQINYCKNQINIKRNDATHHHTYFLDEITIKLETQNLCTKDTNCEQIKHFVDAMNQYETNPHRINTSNTSKTLNHFIHLLQEHHHDAHFEHIYGELRRCDLKECKIFSRNNRNRACIHHEVNNLAINQIMDKMHCYFHHCYDIGHRLSMREKAILNKIDSKKNSEDELPVNTEIISMNKLLLSNRTKYQEIYKESNNRMNTKYSQFTLSAEHKQNESEINRNDEKHFSFGYIFKYGDDDDIYPSDPYFNEILFCIKKPKYGSFKEEITCNGIATLTISQFNNEYEKAEIHFNSNFCKANYRPFIMKIGQNRAVFEEKNVYIQIHHILSLLIYCNYTNLQYIFSKTYRENNGAEHDNFYHLGQNLKICTHQFGTRIQDGQFSTFYHGISQKLLFPQYVGGVSVGGVCINCPLSTTSSFEVATNFTNNNKGLIIEFSNGNTRKSIATTRYFSVSWLSDFGNESEFLFIQNINHSLKIMNVVDVVTGTEYKLILRALNDISNALMDKQRSTISVSIQSLIVSLLTDQISHTVSNSKYKSLKSLTEYGKYICSSYFNDIHWMSIHYITFKQKYRQIFEVLFHANLEWINLNTVYSIFPNCRFIQISGINISSAIFDDILVYFKQKNDQCIDPEITIRGKASNPMSVQEIIRKYATLFYEIDVFVKGYFIKKVANVLHITFRCKNNLEGYTHTKFVCMLMGNVNNTYYGKETSLFMRALIESELNNNASISVHNGDKQIFHQYCHNKKKISTNCKSNSGWIIEFNIFHHSEPGWINIARLNALFPNLVDLDIINVSLGSVVMDDILKHLTNSKTQLKEIVISKPSKQCEMSILSAVNRYKAQFENIKFDINQVQGKRVRVGKDTVLTFNINSRCLDDPSLVISKVKKTSL